MLSFLRSSLLSVLLVLPCLAFAQTTTLQLNARTVVLDVAVTDDAGHAVTDLKASDFKIFEDKQLQTINSFQQPSAHAMPVRSPDAPLLVRSSADLVKIGDAPITLIVLDELNMNFEDEVYAREKVAKWLAAQPPVLPQPTMLLAVDYKSLHLLTDTTQDRDRIAAVLKKHVATVPWRSTNAGSVGGAASDILAYNLGALEQIAHAMRGVPGKKNVIWAGKGFPTVEPSAIGSQAADEVFSNLRKLSGDLLQARITLTVLGASLQAPNRPQNIETHQDELEALGNAFDFTTLDVDGTLRFADLAAPTGGRAYQNRNDLDGELAEAVASGENYYTLAYRPTNTSDDPAKYRKIRVEVSRPGLHVQTRDGYYPVPVRDPAAEPPAPSKQQLVFDLYGTAVSTVPFLGLHLTPAKLSGSQYALTLPASELGWKRLPDGKLVANSVVLAVYFGATGKNLGHTFDAIGSDTMSTEAQLLGRELTFRTKVTPPIGTARIRFVVRDTYSSRVGAADVTY
jgi:VWFA-related protein